VLAARGLKVTAVDPAALDPRCEEIPGIEHLSMLAESFSASRPSSMFDLVVNDMKMDPDRSAEIMRKLSRHLRPAGHGLMTMKLPYSSPSETLSRIQDAREILEEVYVIAGMRQLFHNRSEITVHLQSRS
jgi:23S rRNA (cytidine2498-2'-O)-methyltransferase